MEGKENHGRNWEEGASEKRRTQESLRRRKRRRRRRRRRRRGPTRLLSFFASERICYLFSKRFEERPGEREIDYQRGRDEEELRKNDEGYERWRGRRRRRAGLFLEQSIFFICEMLRDMTIITITSNSSE